MPPRSRCGATDRILLKEAALILRRDGPDDRLEGHGPPVAIPPLSLAQVTGGECQLTPPDGHGDGDQVALLTYRTGALRLVAHVRMVCECPPFDHSLLTPFHAPQTGPVTPSAGDQVVAPTEDGEATLGGGRTAAPRRGGGGPRTGRGPPGRRR